VAAKRLPRIITDNGSQFVAKDLKAFFRHFQTSHVCTSPHYPQSKGKIERFHRMLKEQAIRPKSPLTLNDAKRVTETFIDHYSQVRLHSALGYIAPTGRLANRHRALFERRDLKLEASRQIRKNKRQQLTAAIV
jgi:transposase InsO family protein